MVMSMMGAWCVELAEFIAIAKQDQNTVKGMLSMRSDRVVLPYAKMASDHPAPVHLFRHHQPRRRWLPDRRHGQPPVLASPGHEGRRRVDRDAPPTSFGPEAYRAFLTDEQWWLSPEEEVLAGASVAARKGGRLG